MSKNITEGRIQIRLVWGNVVEIEKRNKKEFRTLRQTLFVLFIFEFSRSVGDATAWLGPGSVDTLDPLLIFFIVNAVEAIDTIDPVSKTSGYFPRICSWIPVVGYLTFFACLGVGVWHYFHFGSW
jgi:hypothetical protein